MLEWQLRGEGNPLRTVGGCNVCERCLWQMKRAIRLGSNTAIDERISRDGRADVATERVPTRQGRLRAGAETRPYNTRI